MIVSPEKTDRCRQVSSHTCSSFLPLVDAGVAGQESTSVVKRLDATCHLLLSIHGRKGYGELVPSTSLQSSASFLLTHVGQHDPVAVAEKHNFALVAVYLARGK